MAAIKEVSSISTLPSTTTREALLPPHVAGDLLLIIMAERVGNVAFTRDAATIAAGWSEPSVSNANSLYVGYSYLIASTSSTANPVFSIRGGQGFDIFCLIITDADATVPIHGSSYGSVTAGRTETCQPLTTTVNDCLVLYFIGYTSDAMSTIPPTEADYVLRVSSVNPWCMLVSTQQFTAGPVAEPTVFVNRDDRTGNMLTIAIANKSGGARNIHGSDSVYPLRKLGFEDAAWSNLDAFEWFTGIGDVPISETAHATTATLKVITSAESVTSPGVLVGLFDTLTTPIDLTNKTISFDYSVTNTAGRTGVYGVGVILADSDGYWVAYSISKGQYETNGSWYHASIAPGNATVAGSGGTIDLTDVKYVGFYKNRLTTATTVTYFGFDQVMISGVNIFAGGGASYPLRPAAINRLSQWENVAGPSTLQGSGQLYSRTPIQLGDGVNPTYVDFSGCGYETPTSHSAINSFLYQTSKEGFNNVLSGGSDFTIKAASGDSILLANSAIVSSRPGCKFTIDAASATDATYTFGQIVGWEVTWKTGVDCISASFSECKAIDGKAAAFSGCRITDANDTAAIKFTNGATLTDCTFVSAGTGHAVEFTEAGTYTITDTTFTGYGAAGGTDATFYNSSGGAVTVNISGSGTPTITNSSGSTTTLAAPQATLTIVANVSLVGAEVRIYDLDTSDGTYGTELDGVESHNAANFVLTDEIDNLVAIQIMLDGYEELVVSHTIANLTETLNVTLIPDRNA